MPRAAACRREPSGERALFEARPVDHRLHRVFQPPGAGLQLRAMLQRRRTDRSTAFTLQFEDPPPRLGESGLEQPDQPLRRLRPGELDRPGGQRLGQRPGGGRVVQQLPGLVGGSADVEPVEGRDVRGQHLIQAAPAGGQGGHPVLRRFERHQAEALRRRRVQHHGRTLVEPQLLLLGHAAHVDHVRPQIGDPQQELGLRGQRIAERRGRPGEDQLPAPAPSAEFGPHLQSELAGSCAGTRSRC